MFGKTHMRQKIKPLIFLYKEFLYSGWTVLDVDVLHVRKNRGSVTVCRTNWASGSSQKEGKSGAAAQQVGCPCQPARWLDRILVWGS